MQRQSNLDCTRRCLNHSGDPSVRQIMATPLSTKDIAGLNTSLPHWQVEADRLKRDWQFKDFSEAFAFMTRVALLAETMQHHPNWSNIYNRVSIELTTHDLDGLSDLDVQLARSIDALS